MVHPRALLTAYMKSYMRNRLVSKWMTLTFVQRILCHIRHWIFRKLLEIEA